MTVAFPTCSTCRHFDPERRDANTCAAFPDGIPDVIIFAEQDHKTPYPGDNGIQYEPRPEDAA